MKKSLFLLSLLIITFSLSAQPTQINGNQIKNQAITNEKIADDANISYTKINFSGIPPSVLGLEAPLTFNAPISKTGTTVSLSTIPVSLGGTGFSSIAAGRVLFGNDSTTLNINTNFIWDNAAEKLSVTNLKLTGGTPTTIGYVLAASNTDGTVSFYNPANTVPTNTIIPAGYVVVGTGTSIGGSAALTFDGTNLSLSGGVDFYPTGSNSIGLLTWNNPEGTLSLTLKGGNTALQLGQETATLVYNNTGSPLAVGQVVYASGVQGSSRVTAALAKADSLTTSEYVIGVVSEGISDSSEGFIIKNGLVKNFDTSSLTEGAIVYISPTTAGQLTTTRPVSPSLIVPIGVCVKQNATTGILWVNISPIQEVYNNTLVEAVTATKNPVALETQKLFTNEGDSDGATITLPAASKGVTYTVYVQTGQTLTITANTGDTIRIGASVTAAAGSITNSTVGSSVTLVAINDTEWVATSVIGTWVF